MTYYVRCKFHRQDDHVEGDPFLPMELLYLIACHSPTLSTYIILKAAHRVFHLTKQDLRALVKRLSYTTTRINYEYLPWKSNVNDSYRRWQDDRSALLLDYGLKQRHVITTTRLGKKAFGVKFHYWAKDLDNVKAGETVLTKSTTYKNNRRSGPVRYYGYEGECTEYTEYVGTKRHGLYLGLASTVSQVGDIEGQLEMSYNFTCLDDDVIQAMYKNDEVTHVWVWRPKPEQINRVVSCEKSLDLASFAKIVLDVDIP